MSPPKTLAAPVQEEEVVLVAQYWSFCASVSVVLEGSARLAEPDAGIPVRCICQYSIVSTGNLLTVPLMTINRSPLSFHPL